MQEGTLTRDSFSQLMRSLSRKRRQGTLEVETEEGGYALQFLSGKIVEVSRDSEALSIGVLAKLRKAGCISDVVTSKLAESPMSIESIYDLLVGKELLAHEEFLLAKEAYERNILHQLRTLEGEFRFRPQIVKVDRRIALNVWPGQLLLDYIELDNDEKRFCSVFESLSSEEIMVSRVEEEAGRMTEAERVIFEHLEVQTCLKDLAEASLLCEFSIKESLLSLYDREVIGVSHMSEDDDILADLEATGEQIIEEAVSMLSDVGPEDEFVRMRDEPGEEVYTSAAIVEAIDSESLEEELPVKDIEESVRTQYIEEPKIETEEVVVDEGPSVLQDVKGQLVTLNYMLLDKHGMGTSTVFVLMVYLVCLALVSPSLFETWFEALRTFSSTGL